MGRARANIHSLLRNFNIAVVGAKLPKTLAMVGETNSIRVNGEHRRVQKGLTVGQLVEEMGLTKATVERNAEPLADLRRCVEDGDDYEIFEQL